MGSIILPVSVPNRARMIRGGSRVYAYEYIAAGVLPTLAAELVYLGQLDGPIDRDGGPRWGKIPGNEDHPGNIEKYLDDDSLVFNFVLREVYTEIIALLQGGDPTIAASAFSALTNMATETGSGLNKEVALGGVYGGAPGVFCHPFIGFIVSQPNEGTADPCDGFEGFTQIAKADIELTGAISHVRKGIHTAPVKIEAYWDETITPNVTPGIGALNEALGHFGRFHSNFA